ncbi:hypothetical protein F5B20DRAFT_550593 [Whalleya microplaca]|nr:hypothetical protein F5B20DRAFT_550593 [Whalleya microplaca]
MEQSTEHSTEHFSRRHASDTRSHRKGHYSCEFCRSRKLRCDRPLPCANCVSRGKKCHFGPAAAQRQHQQQQPDSTAVHPPLPSPQPTAPDQGGLLAEIQSLRKLAQDLENRVVQSTSHQWSNNDSRFSQLSSPHSPGSSFLEIDRPTSSDLGQLSKVVAHLERVSMRQSSNDDIYVDDLVFKVDRIQVIPRAPSYTVKSSKPTRCVWLPRHDEATILLGKFIANVSYIHHVVHHPSLPAIIDNVYRQIGGQEPIKPGHLVLLLSIVASATHVWISHDDVGHEDSLFSSSAQANAQTPLWIKAAHDVLNSGQNGPTVALETIQGIVIMSFLVCNLEGVSLRYRSLISTGLLLGRELGLHRIDHESNAASANTIQAEVGRRVWWYLVATDWLLAARYGSPGDGVYQSNPRQMIVKKPRNINDVDLLDNGLNLDRPIFQPTEMSYFRQRIRLAEISRRIVDQYHDSMALTSSGGPSSHAQIMAMDAELDQMIHDIPPFFQLDKYEHARDLTTSGIFIQAYLLNSIIYTQQCKLHLGYLASKPNKNPTYASSRETCLKAARQILRAEAQLEHSQHVFVQIRLRLSGILHGVFMAGIVLLMDACINGTTSQQDEIYRGEAAEALRIIENARSHSVAAANLYESLTQVLAKHHAQQQQTIQRTSAPLQLGASHATASTIMNIGTPYVHQASPNPTLQVITRDDPPVNTNPNQLPMPLVNSQPSPNSNQLARNLEGLIDLDVFQWDDLFSGIESSSFF